MCEQCTPFATKKFSSHEDFTIFEKELEAKCVDRTFIRVVSSDDTEEFSLQSMYQCTVCGEDWILPTPENTSRGYFLANQESTQEETHSNFQANFSKGGKGNCGCCLGMIFLFIALIIYGLYSLFSFLFDVLF